MGMFWKRCTSTGLGRLDELLGQSMKINRGRMTLAVNLAVKPTRKALDFNDLGLPNTGWGTGIRTPTT